MKIINKVLTNITKSVIIRDRKGVINTEEEIKKALHEQIDRLEISDEGEFEIQSIRIVASVYIKRKKAKQGTDKK